MTSKIFRSTVLVAALVLLCSLSVVMGVLYNHFTLVQISQLKDELHLATTGTELYGNAFLSHVGADRFRLTWIASDGAILFDTLIDATTMENHADREEIRTALETGTGSAVRLSSTLTEQTFYEAVRLTDGTVLRISTSQRSAWSLLLGMLWPVFLITILAIALSAILAQRMAKKIVEPLNTLDLEHPLKNHVYDELTPLLHRIHRQHNQIASQFAQLQRKTDEFTQITDHMQEGLLLLSAEGTILSINPTAKRLFAMHGECVGKNILTLDRSSAMRTAVNDAFDKGHGYLRQTRNGRTYQFDLSRIASDGQVIGSVVLAFDVTERANAEQLRREFTANVSHELKTPLQGILGSTELLENGLVKPDDEKCFLGNIHKEASRLLCLIEDIIRLSQLDEGVALPTEQVDMYTLCLEVADTLRVRAEEKQITLTVCGNGFCVQGVRRLLYEIIYNLCDNAIGYNRPHGSVTVSVAQNTLRVSDTGIGISPEHLPRVFERFYRVDKSHSKRSGGTGLGLSIVKHAATYHGAELAIESTPDVGTSIAVTFPC